MRGLLVEIVILALVPAALVGCVVWQTDQSGIIVMAVAVLALLAFLVLFERSRPPLRVVMPTVVMAALAAAGRVLFAPLPNVKPVSAICIIAGVVFGRHAGFMVGALAALVSNFFFGQGAWTPFQMYAWGLVGWLAGVIAQTGAFDWHPTIAGKQRTSPWLYAFGFASCLLYGFILDTWSLVAWLHPLAIEAALATYALGFLSTLTHAIATTAFLVVLYAPWRVKLDRIVRKYALSG